VNVTIPLSLGQVNDAVEIEKGISYTPVTGKNLNEDGAVVSKYGCMHLYGFYPQKPVNYQELCRAMPEQLKRLAPGSQGMQVRFHGEDQVRCT
jgi:hypothetical protein